MTQLPLIQSQITCLSTFLTWIHFLLHPLSQSSSLLSNESTTPSGPFTSSSSNSSSLLPGHLLPLKALPPLVSPTSSIMSRVNSDFYFPPSSPAALKGRKITTKRWPVDDWPHIHTSHHHDEYFIYIQLYIQLPLVLYQSTTWTHISKHTLIPFYLSLSLSFHQQVMSGGQVNKAFSPIGRWLTLWYVIDLSECVVHLVYSLLFHYLLGVELLLTHDEWGRRKRQKGNLLCPFLLCSISDSRAKWMSNCGRMTHCNRVKRRSGSSSSSRCNGFLYAKVVKKRTKKTKAATTEPRTIDEGECCEMLFHSLA